MKYNKNIIIPANDQKRQGWEESFQEMAKNGDDELIIPDVFEDEDLSDWTWKETDRSILNIASQYNKRLN